MKNMGLTSLRLVDPCRYQTQEAFVRASGAGEIIRNAVVYDSLADALVKCTTVFGTSARSRTLENRVLPVRDAASLILEKLSNKSAATGVDSDDVAIVFGRERSGLSNEELSLCDWRLHIPCNPDFSSLNLGSAVQVVAYELHQANALCQNGSERKPKKQLPALADNPALEGFFSHMEQTLIDIGFLDPQNPRLLMPKIRLYFMRNRPNTSELNILRGILSSAQKSSGAID